jgi:hypothetical protein
MLPIRWCIKFDYICYKFWITKLTKNLSIDTQTSQNYLRYEIVASNNDNNNPLCNETEP